MGAVADFVEDVAGGVSDVVQSVGNAVEDVGNAIMEEVVQPVVDTVDRTIEAAMEDPVGTAVKIAAISTGNPAIMAAANAAVAVANGANFEDAVVAAGKGYAASVIGGEIASSVAPELASAGDLTANQASTAANVLGQTAGAAATGGDPLSALVTGTIGAGAGAVASEIPGFEDLSKTQQAAISRAIALEAQGQDGSQALLNALVGAGVNAVKDSSGEPVIKAEEDNINDFINQLAESQPEDTLTQQVNDILNPDDATEEPLLVDPVDVIPPDQTMKDFLESIGVDPIEAEELLQSVAVVDESKEETPLVQEPVVDETPVQAEVVEEDPLSFLTEKEQTAEATQPEQTTDDFYKLIGIDPATLSDMPAATEDPLAFLNTSGYYDEITGRFIPDELGGLQAPLDDTSGTNLESMDGYTTKDGVTTTPSGESYDLSYLDSSYTPLDTSKLSGTPAPDTSVGDMVTKFLNQTLTNKKAIAGLAGLGVASALGSSGSGGSSGAGGSGASSADQADDGFNPYAEQFVNWNAMPASLDDQGIAYGLAQLNPQFSVNAAQGGIMSLAGGGPAQSSLGGYAAGGNPRLLRGPGDGMSDNIPATISGKQPARLADGEFVVPADVVSHLGNGSTEAGANILYQMMERVRKARTGNSKQGKQINPNKFIPRKGK
jgi:hypothetical protein